MVQLIRLPKLEGPCTPGKRNRSEGPQSEEEDEDLQPSQKEARQDLGQEGALSNEESPTWEATTGDQLQEDGTGAENCSQASTPRVKTIIQYFNLKSTPKLADTPKSTKHRETSTPARSYTKSSPSARENLDQPLKIQETAASTQNTKDRRHQPLLDHPGRPPEIHKDKEI